MAQAILVVALAWWGHSERGAWEGRRQVAAEGALEKGHRRNGLDTLSPFTCSVEWAMQAEPWRTVYWRCSCSRRARLLRPSLMTAAVLVLVVARHSGASTLTEALVAVAVAVAAAAAGGGHCGAGLGLGRGRRGSSCWKRVQLVGPWGGDSLAGRGKKRVGDQCSRASEGRTATPSESPVLRIYR